MEQDITANRLSARSVATIKEPGRHADGGNLYLYVSKTGGRSWAFMWSRAGRQREMGLGPVADVTLVEARDAAREGRRHLLAGRDPLAERGRKTKSETFGEVADAYLLAMKSQWANEKHIYQWTTALERHAARLRPKPIGTIDTADVLEAIKPIWTRTPETGSRLRGRIEAVLDAAKAQGLRSGDNPARWRGHLDQLLPKRQKLSRGHHAAMPYADVPAFLTRLRTLGGMGALALGHRLISPQPDA